ncbi:hypothetical protein HY971_02925 [Candidatus Kaiserbacteria bacterium]|nr:hypothetical protein [Candidatus Kaiserbacteria bacterium]
MFKRLVAMLLAVSLCMPHVAFADPLGGMSASYKALFSKYITPDFVRGVYIDKSLSVDSWCMRDQWVNPQTGKRCRDGTERPLYKFVIPQIVYQSQGGTNSTAAAVRNRRSASPLGAGQEIGVEELEPSYYPAEFYLRGPPREKNAYGVFPWTSFIERVVVEAGSFVPNKAPALVAFDVAGRAYDSDIKRALPAHHEFGESEVCWVIAQLSSAQRNGETGALVANGHANVFYTASHAVLLIWCGAKIGWGIGAWQSGNNRWETGDRVFIPKPAT